MAKNSMVPMPTSGGSVLPKLISTAVVIALLIVLVRHPSDSAEWLKGLFGLGKSAVDGLAAFFHSLAS